MSPNDRPEAPFLHIPETVSAEAQAYMRTLTDPALVPPFPEPADMAGWAKLQAFIEADALPKAAPIVERYAPSVTERAIGGVPVLDVRPRGWTDTGRLAVYTHGGAHTMYSARSMLGRAAIFSDDTGLRTVSVDYTLAPHAKFRAITDQVAAVVAGLIAEGARLADIVMYGDSSGGGLAASAILKMRDQGMGLPAAAILVSPWTDLTPAGDTEVTLRHAEPNYLYERHSVKAAGAYADPADQKHPHASPVYGDFAPGFPPTLIQGGTKEILLSGFIRLYQALDMAGQTVKLDLYEGMPHNFASRMPDAPESRTARRKIADFIARHVPQSQGSPLEPFPQPHDAGPWSAEALALLRDWDPAWTADAERMTRAAWQAGALSPRVAALVALAVASASTALDAHGTRHHIRGAIAAGASKAEVLTVLKMAALLSIHTCSLGAPILLEEAKAAGLALPPAPDPAPSTPACDRLRAAGQWNAAWDPFFQLAPEWTDAFMAAGGGIYLGGIEPKLAELLSIAFDASIRHMYAPGTRRHIRNALALGATVAEVMGVLQICVAQGAQALNSGVPILAEALASASGREDAGE